MLNNPTHSLVDSAVVEVVCLGYFYRLLIFTIYSTGSTLTYTKVLQHFISEHI